MIEFLKLDGLVALGGDGTLTFARRLHKEGVPLVAIPKTMDNDVFGTDYCLGFSTAVTRSVMFINDLRTGAGSHERFLVVELFGRYSGETCLLASYLAGVDRAVIAEVPFDCEKLYHMLDADRSDNPSNYAVVAVSEGATHHRRRHDRERRSRRVRQPQTRRHRRHRQRLPREDDRTTK